MLCSRPWNNRSGFTMIELIVVMLMIGILASLVLPAIFRARQVGAQTTCANNLHQIGIAIHSRLIANVGTGRYCSGAFLPTYDGNPVKTGWVADMLAEKMPAEVLLCPSNLAQRSESLSLEVLRPAFAKGNLPSVVTSGTDASLLQFAEDMVREGFNTNYCQIWTMARTDLMPAGQRKGSNTNDVMDLKNCSGPLTMRDITRHPSERVMFLGDALPVMKEEGTFATAITKGPLNPGDPQTKHDFTSLGAVHGGNKIACCNILFADGHVETVRDEDQDGDVVKDVARLAHIRGMRAKYSPQ